VKALLYHLDGKLPNIALMRIAAHHRDMGHDVELRRGKPGRTLFDEPEPDFVYGSAIFKATAPVVQDLKKAWPQAIIGGTGVDIPPLQVSNLEKSGVYTLRQDYSIYPDYQQSIGFSQRGCRLRCEFCVVPSKEGRVRPEQTIYDIWRGDPWPREVVLLDNDFFGNPEWKQRIAEIREGRFKVSFTQGINARCLTDEAAEAIASVDYRNDSMDTKRIYTAWDNKGDESRLFDGLNKLVKYGVKPYHIMVFMLVGYWPMETAEDRDYRRKKLRDFGAMPYPMPFVRSRELVGFQRWIVGSYDKRISWDEWEQAGYRPERLGERIAAVEAMEVSG
jgi:hypothetical protein